MADKERCRWGDTRERRDTHAASPLIGIILLFALVMMGAMLVFVAGSAMFDVLQSQTHAEQTEQTLKQFDSDLATLGMQNDTPKSVYLDEGTENEIVIDGELTVTVSDGYVKDESDPIELRTLVTTDESGNEFAYQGGGLWRLNDDRATAVTDPNLRYYTETVNGEHVGRVDVSPTTIDGSIGSGEHSAQQTGLNTFDSFGEDIEYVNYVTVEVTGTSYHHGWYDFLKEEFDATDESKVSANCTNPGNVDENIICHDELGETVTVVATVDGEAPLANLVDIEPTVYGGLYIEGTSDRFSNRLEVNGYDGHRTGTNESEDLFLANYDTYTLDNHANIAGVPVVNGDLSSLGNPELSSIGYGLTVNPVHNRGPFDEDNNAYWLGASESDRDALATELSTSYSDIDEVNSEIDDVQTNYLGGNPTADGAVTAGLYEGTGSIDTLDSSDGNVHIGVDSDVDLNNVEVKGDNRTSIYVDGDVELSDVDIEPDDRANALWIYASSDSEITIDGDFQGVIYAPGADIEIADRTTIDGAIVAGNDAGIGDNVEINFDRSLRTDTPLSDADENKMFEYGDTRAPIDATFVLDRSGSMGPHNPNRPWNTYTPIDEEYIYGDDWRPIPVDEPFRNVDGDDVILRNTTTGETKRLERRDPADPDNWQEIRVESCYRCHPDAILGTYNHPGNDPSGVRVEATRNFIELMKESNGDRVGVYEFEQNANVLHELDGDLEAAKQSVEGNAYYGTNMAAGLDEALDDYRKNEDTDQERITVLLSDGKNSDDDYNDDMDDLVDEANTLNTTIYTVGLTGPEDAPIPESQLENWAQDTGGEFYKADNADALREIFETIAKDEVEVDADTQIGISVTNEQETTSGYAISVSEQTITIDE
ncbi:vWA domain-containing protein [Natrinema sp. CBA1119]|uniref:vWA domain-containing protein n=1 Tax=Natrinema sp. CBA1119 TaxID=1608465 RepID=UPI0020D27535|nr:vWA domain-containing protein [Natrinema sp. CBA1119]